MGGYSWSNVIFLHMPKRCAWSDVPASGSYHASLGSAQSFCNVFLVVLCFMDGVVDFSAYDRKMCKGRFPPFGFVSSEFGLCAFVLQEFLAGFDSVDSIMDFLTIGQKDAQGSVSSLRVRIKRVLALRTRFAMVVGGF